MQTLGEGTRRAAKVHHCEMCTKRIKVGEQHHVTTYVYDGRVYDWRTCWWCRQDSISVLVWDWAWRPDEGVDYDSARDWALEAIEWPQRWDEYNRPIRTDERMAARAWLARAVGGEGE